MRGIIVARSTQQRGFTIVELMIATSILSVILLASTVIITNIGNLYYKGVNTARAQDNVRDIASQLVQDFQLSGGDTPSPATSSGYTYLCVGNVRYRYVLGKQISGSTLGPTQTAHVLWRDTMPAAGCGTAVSDFTTGGNELIAPRSRLTQLTIGDGGTNGVYTITVTVAFGDDDLLCSPSLATPANSCSSNAVLSGNDFLQPDITCKDGKSGKFCAVGTITTAAVRRL